MTYATTWTPEQDEQLLILRNKGLSTKKIAAAMGMTKNKVIGRLHRLGLLGEDDTPIVTMEDRLKAIVKFPKLNHCVWPYGDPKELEFHFCHAPVAIFSAPYCREHLATAWIKSKDQPKLGAVGLKWP